MPAHVAPSADEAVSLARSVGGTVALGPQLASLEINPLLVSGDKVEALDGLK